MIAFLLELRRNDVGGILRGDGEGDDGGRHVHILESAAHRVLAAQRSKSERFLHPESTQQRRKRFAPAGGFFAELLEILLEGETDLVVIAAGRHDFRHRFQHRQHARMIRGTDGDEGVVTERHDGGEVRMAVQHRQFLRAHLRLGQLILTAEGHQHRGSADGGVEHLDKTLLGSHVRIGKAVLPFLLHRFPLNVSGFQHIITHGRNLGGHLLAHAVGVDEVAAEIHDGLAAPRHRQAVVVGHLGDDVRL